MMRCINPDPILGAPGGRLGSSGSLIARIPAKVSHLQQFDLEIDGGELHELATQENMWAVVRSVALQFGHKW